MELCYSEEPISKERSDKFENSLFLAGPTPRSDDVESWRPEAIDILEKLNYDGMVWIPEYLNKPEVFDYDHQVNWERWGLISCTKIVFWVPRDLETMPAFTTNVEIGFYLAKSPERCCYGRPKDSPKNEYLDWLYKRETKKPVFEELSNLLIFATS